MLSIGRLLKNILPFVILFSCLSGISYASHVKGNFEVFFPSGMASISLADGNTLSKGTFCVAVENADSAALKLGLDWACGPGLANCSSIQPGQPCYVANNLVAIASYAYDAYYQANQAKGATCSFNNTATLTNNDPSSGSCIFPGSFGSGTNPGGGSGSSGGTNSSGGSGSSSGPSFSPPFAPFVPIDGENGLQVHKAHVVDSVEVRNMFVSLLFHQSKKPKRKAACKSRFCFSRNVIQRGGITRLEAKKKESEVTQFDVHTRDFFKKTSIN